jgi:hypothetical protein
VAVKDVCRGHVARGGVPPDPNLKLTSEANKIFTAFSVLTGIGILVELARQVGVGFIKMREERHATRHARRRHKKDPTETQSPK